MAVLVTRKNEEDPIINEGAQARIKGGGALGS